MHSIEVKDEAPVDLARRALAKMRVEVALESIEEAQRLVDLATQAISAVNGLAPECDRLAALCDHVKRTWCAVNEKAEGLHRRGKLTLDHEPTDNEAAYWASLKPGR